jgi:phospholipid/cholesterol/gamma-HCH transport system substrate-binding protein
VSATHRSRLVPRLLVAGAIAAVLAALAVVLLSGNGKGDHRLTLIAPSAQFFTPGLSVEAAGQPVGEVTATDLTDDNQARVELRIDDDDVWPLPEGTRARLRFGGTVRLSGRYVELRPPARGGDPIPDGGEIHATDDTDPEDFVTSPEEFDDIFRTFGPSTRRNLKAMLGEGGVALGSAADEFRRALDEAPPALSRARALLEDLGADRGALDTLVRSSDRVAAAVDDSDPDVGRLVAGAGTTFAAVASQSRELERALAGLPETLTTTRHTLAGADRTLNAAADLTRRLSPGVDEVRRLASPLAGALGGVVDVGPDARQTLTTLRGAVPDLNPFLGRARRLMPAIGSIGRQASTQLNCIRPYTPEIINFLVSWVSVWGGSEPKDHFARVWVVPPPIPNGSTMTPEQVAETIPGITSVYPRPPGQIVGQPWFQPQCGAGPEALDPSQDPEAGEFDPLSRPLVEFEEDENGGSR